MSKIKNVSIQVTATDGKTYPCRVTLGAMRRFKQVTGKDADKIVGMSDTAAFIWCCCASACSADGVEFGYSLDDFCDRLDITVAEAFSKAIMPDEKKTGK